MLLGDFKRSPGAATTAERPQHPRNELAPADRRPPGDTTPNPSDAPRALSKRSPGAGMAVGRPQHPRSEPAPADRRPPGDTTLKPLRCSSGTSNAPPVLRRPPSAHNTRGAPTAPASAPALSQHPRSTHQHQHQHHEHEVDHSLKSCQTQLQQTVDVAPVTLYISICGRKLPQTVAQRRADADVTVESRRARSQCFSRHRPHLGRPPAPADDQVDFRHREFSRPGITAAATCRPITHGQPHRVADRSAQTAPR